MEMEVVVEAQTLRRFRSIVSRRLFRAVCSCGRSLSILDAVDPAFVSLFGTRLRPSFLRTTPARKPRTECCCHSVTVMMAAIVVPAGARSIVMMRACLVSGRAAGLDNAGADRVRDLPLLIFRAAVRVPILVFDLDFVMESSKVARLYPPHHLGPARTKWPAGQDPEARFSRSKSTQQRSDQRRTPVNSGQIVVQSAKNPLLEFKSAPEPTGCWL
jgi:hypothetical protein